MVSGRRLIRPNAELNECECRAAPYRRTLRQSRHFDVSFPSRPGIRDDHSRCLSFPERRALPSSALEIHPESVAAPRDRALEADEEPSSTE